MKYLIVACAACLILWSIPVPAQQKSFRLAADPALTDNGFTKYLLPRFSLKTGIRITLAEADGADAYLGRAADPDGTAHPVFRPAGGGDGFMLVIRPTDAAGFAESFLDWLRSDIGRRTIGRFKIDGQATYVAVEKDTASVAAPVLTGNVARGEEVAFSRCGRCHVINKKNRFGGIGSTPSFGAMKTLPRWQQRFEAFWTLNPHPSFTQVEGITEPFPPDRPPPIAPIRLTQDELEDLLAFIHTIKVKDLGAPLEVK